MAGLGLGPLLMRRIIDYARGRGLRELFGEVLRENRPMLKLCELFKFTRYAMDDDRIILRIDPPIDRNDVRSPRSRGSWRT